jgi:hypothetical protein
MITLNRMMSKNELALHQDAAEAVTQSGLGTHSYKIAEEQIVPATGQPLEEDSPFVVVTYSGLEDTDTLFGVINSAKVAKLDAERARKPQREIDQAMQDGIKSGIATELERRARINAMMDRISRRR